MSAPRSTPSVSVALCTYNGERYVREQLASILHQSLPVTEVVVGDDGSSDGTLDAIRETAAACGATARVRIAYTDRAGGIVPNMERVLRATTGDLIALADQDDVWHADRVELAVARFTQAPRTLLVAGDARLIDGEGAPVGATLHGHLYVSAAERHGIASGKALEVFIRRNLVTGATAMIRRDLLDVALPLPSSWVHDEWLAIVAAGLGGLELLESPLIDYRVHGGNQIGVAAPTLRRKVGQVTAPRGERLTRLAARSEVLLERAAALGFDAETCALVAGKHAFDAARSVYPARRWRRIGPVLRQLRAGGYAAFASQGTLDAVRDLAQPAGAPLPRT